MSHSSQRYCRLAALASCAPARLRVRLIRRSMATLTIAAAAVGPLSNGGATLAAEGDAGASAPPARFALHSIIVIGQGRATAKPDTALATIGVEVVGKSLQEASDQNNAKMDALLKALKASGVADKDIQTMGYSVSPERKYN